MKHKYNIYCDKKIVGTATIEPDGLYCQVDCTCHYTTNEIHRVFLQTLESEINLGVCVPAGDVVKTKTKVAAKRIDLNNLHFRVVTSKENLSTIFPVQDGCYFPAIIYLRDGLFAPREGSANIMFFNIDPSFLKQHQQSRDLH